MAAWFRHLVTIIEPRTQLLHTPLFCQRLSLTKCVGYYRALSYKATNLTFRAFHTLRSSRESRLASRCGRFESTLPLQRKYAPPEAVILDKASWPQELSSNAIDGGKTAACLEPNEGAEPVASHAYGQHLGCFCEDGLEDSNCYWYNGFAPVQLGDVLDDGKYKIVYKLGTGDS